MGVEGAAMFGETDRIRNARVRSLRSFLVKMREVSGGWVGQRMAEGISIYCLQNPAQRKTWMDIGNIAPV